eukprot:RCo025256
MLAHSLSVALLCVSTATNGSPSPAAPLCSFRSGGSLSFHLGFSAFFLIVANVNSFVMLLFEGTATTFRSKRPPTDTFAACTFCYVSDGAAERVKARVFLLVLFRLLFWKIAAKLSCCETLQKSPRYLR